MRTTRLLLALALASTSLGLAAADARADQQVSYIGMHPVAGGGFCYIEADHVHVYAPAAKAKVMYRMNDDAYQFVGDPVAFQYEGPRYTYQGHHPIEVDHAVGVEAPGAHVEYCYLNGAHYHYWYPAPHAAFEVKGGVYWYVGPFAPEYKLHKKKYVVINAVYEPIVYERPVIAVAPPVGFVGVGVVGGVGVGAGVGAGVGVGAGISAGVGIEVQAPVIEVGLPGVIIETDHHHHHGHGHGHGHKKHKKGKFRRFH
jgi:hypothetical protein